MTTELLCAKLQTFPDASDPFRQGTHSGLDFLYGAGKVRNDNAVTHVLAGTITLTDNADNYIEVDATTGVVSTNTTGFTSGKLPLYTVTTLATAITATQDDRCFFNVGGGTPSGDIFVETVIELLDSGIAAF